MNREQLRAVIFESVGSPSAGVVAEVVDVITDAVDAAVNPVKEVRVIKSVETR